MKLAQLNVGYARYSTNDPRMAEFMNNLDRMNALAERSPGFVWRMKSDSGNATDIAVPGDAEMISNLSVWEDVASLGHYVFNTLHARFYEKGTNWFKPMKTPHFVMWPVADNHIPNLEEAMDRLNHLHKHGASDHAFGWNAVDTSAWRRCAMAAG
ncbi:DUF3291 domain-containing protein [Tateyamaria sp.]|uniref:DUF3291 domain-containing protein n=1 Tax=Tateyamaria sp. TaxID=1929288 RepID=UPI00329E08CC